MDPVLHAGDRGPLDPGVDRQPECRQRLVLRHLERARDAAERIDAHVRGHEAGIEQRVVRRLDPGLADELARACVHVSLRADLGLADLAEQAEELASEVALRIEARGNGPDLQARIRRRPLVEVVLQRGRRSRDDDRGRKRRAHDRALDPRHECRDGHVRELRELLQDGGTRDTRLPAVRVERAERARIGRDDDVTRRRCEHAVLVVDDRAARADHVHGAERLVRRKLLVRGPVQDLDRPRP